MNDSIPGRPYLTSEEQKALLKEAFKEASNEWLDHKFALFGKWSFYSLAALGVVAILYFILTATGWHKV